MYSKEEPVPENRTGRFAVLKSCIRCSACWELAPSFIKSHPDEAYALFYKQPRSMQAIKLCAEALKICPVEAIIDRKAQTPGARQIKKA